MKSLSYVMPRSSVMGSYLVRPRPFRMMALPPSLYSTTSVVRFNAVTLLTAATGVVLWPKYTRKRQLLYGSKRLVLTAKIAMAVPFSDGRTSRGLGLSSKLRDGDYDKLGRFQRREADHYIDNTV